MSIALTPDGNFLLVNGRLSETSEPEQQNFMSEVRCVQNTYAPDMTYGRNPIVWTISQSTNDRIDDLTRIGQKYLVVTSITFNTATQTYTVI